MTKQLCFCLGALAVVAACNSPPGEESAPPAEGYADTIFLGENIITIDPNKPLAGAVAVRGETIVFVGGREKAMSLAGPETRVQELAGNALIPGLIDTHGHFTLLARFIDFVNLSSPPVGPAENVDDVVDLLRMHIATKEIPVGSWVMGYGYDDSLLTENRHPTRDDLDRVSTEHPISIMHVSGHLAVGNSAALVAGGITAESADPPGGVIRRQPGSQEPNGVLEEAAAFAVLQPLGLIGGDGLEPLARNAALHYASFGITTAQDGAASPEDIAALRSFAANKPFAIDIAAYPVVNQYPLASLDQIRIAGSYNGGFRVAGAKFTLDGSPQGRTAWLTRPYTEGPEGADADYVAYPTIDPDSYKAAAARLLENGVPIIAHANGDAAIDLMIDGIAGALAENPVDDHRSVIIHAQLMRPDQLDRAKELGLVPSFFSAHPFFWGDWHRQSFGDDRALNISPIRWAVDRGVPFTIHNDSPVVPPDMMRLLWVTVNRKTRSGFVLGPEQRASVHEALHAITLGAAYQYFEEDRKGSITEGKQADLVVLDRNPLAADPDSLKDINIIETISRGRTVYSAGE